MTNYEKLYWLTRLDSFNGVIMTVTIASLMVAAVGLITYGVMRVEAYKSETIPFPGYIKKASTVLVIFSVIAVFVPTKSDVLFIVAGGETMDFVQSDSSIQALPSQVTTVMTLKLDELLTELDSK